MAKYVLTWAGEQPISKNYFWLERYIFHPKVVGNVVMSHIIWGHKGYVESYWSDKSVLALKADGQRLFDSLVAQEVIEGTRQAVNDFWETVGRIYTNAKKTLSQVELAEDYREFCRVMQLVGAYFITSKEEVMESIERRLYSLLEHSIGAEAQEAFAVLTTPTQEDLMFRELCDWRKIVQNPSVIAIENHLEKYPLMAFSIFSKKEAVELMGKRVSEKTLNELDYEIEKSIKRRTELKEKQAALVKKLKSAEVEPLAGFIQSQGIGRLELKGCWGGVDYFLMDFFEQIARLAHCDLRDLLVFYTPKDILDLLEKNVLIKEEDLNQRKENLLLFYRNKNIEVYFGEKALEVKAKFLDPSLPKKGIKEFTGMIANKGKIIGRVKIIKFDNLREIQLMANKLTKENILVAGMTNPTMVPLFHKVGGIITDEGGITSHAAIISREFNLPCIVGCKIATKVLSDGDLVELDANVGVVRVIKKALV